ncbi:hypothetical protein EWH08_07070 [Sphingobium indicum]|uniref:Uncharacterized protein n=2 Tax=Sphingobium indicum TaxID=332055 RepID=A0A1L5BNG1_SPHIB|nr:hypothetical protein [Sphingobium indicum]APL94470.1 hypothetical protein SIDU_08140 [Sphingobium indicum B90A]RYM04215.1 hypothetical protein EWH08_07070 [Sphingobium indicum]
MAALAADAAGVRARLWALVEARIAVRRRRIAAAALAAGVEEARVEGDAVRLSGVGLRRRWMGDLGLREAGRGR